jgi:hypothetical protein
MSDQPILLTRRGEIDRLVAQPSALSSAFLGWQGLQLELKG